MALTGKEINELTQVVTVDKDTALLIVDAGGVEANSISVADLVSAGITISDASESTKGIIQIATDQEVSSGTNDSKAITPLKLITYLNTFTPGGGGGGGFPKLTWYTSDNWVLSTDNLTLTISALVSPNLVKVYKNGILLRPDEDGTNHDYNLSIANSTVTFHTALDTTDSICIEVF